MSRSVTASRRAAGISTCPTFPASGGRNIGQLAAVPGTAATASTCPGQWPAPVGWPRWSTACPTPQPALMASHTGVTSRSRPPWVPAVLLAAFAAAEIRSQDPGAPASAAQPGPVGCIRDHAVRRYRALARLVTRVGARPLLIARVTNRGRGLFWLSRISEHSQYATGLLGPIPGGVAAGPG